MTANVLKVLLKRAEITLEEEQTHALTREINGYYSKNEYEQLLFVEDGSILEKDIKELKKHNPEIKVVKYRQGSAIPQLKEI